MNADNRIAALRSRAASAGIDVLVLNHVPNVRYMTGFDAVFDDDPAHVAAVSGGEVRLYTDSRYAEAALDAAKGTGWEVAVVTGSLFAEMTEDLNRRGFESLGFETTLPYAHYVAVSDGFEGECVATSSWVEELRSVKEPDELARIVAAQQVTDSAFDHILGFIAPGMAETEVALELEYFMRTHGSDGMAFEPIVASGPNSALPHARPSDRRIVRGDLLKMDFGARVGGYCSDMTRTVVVGKASERQREIYDTVLSANQAGIEAVKAGTVGSDIDAAARRVIEARGFGECFRHGLGHGVGLEVHELPSVGIRSTSPVAAGSVVTIEPGVYVPGFGGVRIEDLVTVESAGGRVLTRSTKELIEL